MLYLTWLMRHLGRKGRRVRAYKGKVTVAGNVVHVARYEEPVVAGWKRRERIGSAKEVMGEMRKDRRKRNERRAGLRAKRKLMDLVRANAAHEWRDHEGRPCTVKFLTLTFAENVQDLEWANKEFKKFIKRLNYAVTGKKKAFLEYVAVVEFQKRGAVHYHVMFFNMPYVDVKEVIAPVWGHGSVKINKVDEVDDLGAYMAKYMGKTFDSDDDDDPPPGGGGGKKRRDKGKKRYFASRGLIRPKEMEVQTDEELDQLAASLAPYKTFEREYQTEYFGNVVYTQYNMKRRRKDTE
jgi:hypothetical protein